MGDANLDVLARSLLQMAKSNPDIVVVTSDSRGSGKLTDFGEELPQQIVEIGIAEQNLVGVAAGLSSMGKQVYAVSPACFLTSRSFEQIKNDVAYSDHPVKLIGISAGISYGSLGTTHHSLYDFAALQAIHNVDIVAPADNFETAEAIKASLTHKKPLYIRFGKKNMPLMHIDGAKFEIGKAIQLTPQAGHYDLTIIANGETVMPAFLAGRQLAQTGIKCCLLSLHSIRPFDEEAVFQAASRSEAVITVEEHSINGGLGSRVASFLMQSKIFVPLKVVGLPDEHTINGSQTEIFDHYGISADGITRSAFQLLTNGK